MAYAPPTMIKNGEMMGADLLALVPSRGRPTVVPILADIFRTTCTTDWHLVFAVDEQDEDLPLYTAAISREPRTQLYINRDGATMVAALNAAARHHLDSWPQAVAFMGDDHRPRTQGWDRDYLDALREMGTGMVYGNDLLQGEKIPTQIAMTANIPRTLGHMCPSTLTHLFVDNYWRDLGTAVGCLRYLPDTIVEHLHPFAGKAGMDEGYHRVNAPSMYHRDAFAYRTYVETGQLAADTLKIKGIRS